MKILMLTKNVPFPPNDGSSIRNFQFLRILAEHHEVSVVTIVRSDREAEGLSVLRELGATVYPVSLRRTTVDRVVDLFRSVLTGIPYTVLANTDQRLIDEVRRALAERAPDVVMVQELYLMENIAQIVSQVRTRAPIVLDLHNIEGVILERMAELSESRLARMFYRWQAHCMHAFERHMLPLVNGLIAVSKIEYHDLGIRHPLVIQVPNGVVARDMPPPRSSSASMDVVFVGTLDYPPNRDAVAFFVGEILPRIRSRLPEVTFTVIGRKPRRPLALHGATGVRLLTNVDDLAAPLRESALMVVPLRAGAGTRLKILDAFSAAVPVVSTSLGAEGLGVTDGAQLLLRDSAESFADAVVQLLSDRSAGERLAENAFRWSQQHLRWEEGMRPLESLLEQLNGELRPIRQRVGQ